MNSLNALFETQRKMSKLVKLGNSFRTSSDVVSKFAQTENALFETHRKMSKLVELSNSFKKSSDVLSKFVETENRFRNSILGFEQPNLYKAVLEKQDLFKRLSLNTSVFDRLKKLDDVFRGNPEIAFISIAELELLSIRSTSELADVLQEDISDELISSKERLLEEFLLPHLERLNLDDLWIGADRVLNTTDNPDKLRQALSSLRALLETLIDQELAPRSELSKSEMFTKEFKKYREGKVMLEDVWVKDRAKKIKFFMSKIQFGILEEFTQNDISLVCNCYSVLCNLHKANVDLTENQVRVLKVKTGIIIWLLAYVNEIIRNEN